MQTPLLSHVLAVEFPELAEAIHHLKAHDHHFAKLMHEHDEIDQKITSSEEGLIALDDRTMTELKLKRLHLKEDLHRRALAQKNG